MSDRIYRLVIGNVGDATVNVSGSDGPVTFQNIVDLSKLDPGNAREVLFRADGEDETVLFSIEAIVPGTGGIASVVPQEVSQG